MNKYARTQMIDSGACAGCHSHGLGGTYLSYDEQETFEANQLQPFILKIVASDYDSSNKLTGLQTSTRLFAKESGGQSCPEIDLDDFDICHPELDVQIAEDQGQRWTSSSTKRCEGSSAAGASGTDAS